MLEPAFMHVGGIDRQQHIRSIQVWSVSVFNRDTRTTHTDNSGPRIGYWTPSWSLSNQLSCDYARAHVVVGFPLSAISTISRQVVTTHIQNHKQVCWSYDNNKIYQEQEEERADICRLKHARYSTTCQEYIKTWTTLTGGLLDWISTLFMWHNQGVSHNLSLLCTRRHMNLYHRYTCSILCAYTSCLLVRVRKKNGLLSDFAPLHDGSVVSVHIILQNRHVDRGTITQGGHRPTGSMRGHI